MTTISLGYGGRGKYGGSARAISDLFNTLGSYERARRELQMQQRFLELAADPENDYDTIVSQLVSEQTQPQYSKGFAGAMQRLGGRFMPPTSPFMQNLAATTIATTAALKKYAAQPTEFERLLRLVPPEKREQAIEAKAGLEPTQTKLRGQEILRLQEKQKTPEGLTSTEQASLKTLLEGKAGVEISFGKPASPTERASIAEGRASLDALDNLKALFDNQLTKVGIVSGRVAPIAGLLGLTTDEQEAFMAATSAFKNAIIKQITGAQMSEAEAQRIMKQVPDITDPPARWRAKWEESRKNLEFLQKRRMEILEQSGLRVPTEGGQVVIPPDIANMTDEELKALAGVE